MRCKGQISLEFLVAVLVMMSVLTLLISYQNEQTQNLRKTTQDIEEKMQADVIGAYCNLFYFNKENLKLELQREMVQGIEKRVECFGAPVAWRGNELRVSKGIKRW